MSSGKVALLSEFVDRAVEFRISVSVKDNRGDLRPGDMLKSGYQSNVHRIQE